jgi:hypothetical protein
MKYSKISSYVKKRMTFFTLKTAKRYFVRSLSRYGTSTVPVQLECEKDELKTVNGAEELQLKGPVVSHAPHANGN